ncbi:MAG TPA: thioredoxin domain-containing protein [Patescibacteria group bacterium]|nr:thioredoxin domain-containing protein [Patescibacteria group bacterium]
MKDFLNSNKVFIGVVLATLVLLTGGIYLFTKGGSSPPTSNKISEDILVPPGSNITGGLVNGVYQEASKNATLTLVEFGDFECPACGAYHPLTKQLITEYAGKMNFVFRNFALSQHANAPISSYAAEAAALQGKFWQMHDKLYENQNEWATSGSARDILIGYAQVLGLNTVQFKADIDSQKVHDKVSKDSNDGDLIGVNSTPTFYINGEKVENLPGSYDEFKALIVDAINKKPLSSASQQEAFHIHFDLKVYLNGKAVDLSQDKYQSTEGHELSPNIHLHDGNGKVVHVHKQNIQLRVLFDSLKITLPDNVLAYVNGKRVTNILDYIPQDLDQILIGSSNLSSVSNDACIYSLKCPERGAPPTENCVGGLGTGCTD